jgi:hypothetical protein
MTKPTHTARFDQELHADSGQLVLRKYLDLPKFIDLIRTSELYLRQAARFEDVLEGTLPEQLRSRAHKTVGNPTVFEKRNRERAYLSCWSLGARDNMALWKLYGGSTQSVAITTTIGRLTKVAPTWAVHGDVEVRKIRYVDFAGEILPDGAYGYGKDLFSLKHDAYSYENEVRIVITRLLLKKRKPLPEAVRVPVDLDTFIRSVVVAPNAGKWFHELVTDLSEKYNLRSPVRQSELTFLTQRNGTRKLKKGVGTLTS